MARPGSAVVLAMMAVLLSPGLAMTSLTLSTAALADTAPETTDTPAVQKPMAKKLVAKKTVAKKSHAKKRYTRRHISRHWHGYGFLPGYRPPEVVARERAEHYWSTHPNYYGPAHPQYYHGRWNGGGFGPCYTSTPIGYMWNCGP